MPIPSNTPHALLFEPNDETRGLERYFLSNPHFLYRVHTPQTSGQTETKFVASSGAEEGHKDILQLDKDAATKMIGRHMSLFYRGTQDNLMSWTSSLLFAIVYAIWRKETIANPDQVRIFILDTSRLPPKAFLPLIPLLEAYKTPLEDKLDHKWHHEEYLSQGKLEIPQGAMEVTTLKNMFDIGLQEFYPKLASKMHFNGFYIPVAELRRLLDTRQPLPPQASSPTPEDVRLVTDIAEGCYKSTTFRYALFAGLMTLKFRGRRDELILKTYNDLHLSKS